MSTVQDLRYGQNMVFGRVTLTNNMVVGSSSNVTSDQTAYNVTNVNIVRLNPSPLSFYFYGLTGGTDPHIIQFQNLSSSKNVTFMHQSAFGTQKFWLVQEVDKLIGPYEGIRFACLGGVWCEIGQV